MPPSVLCFRYPHSLYTFLASIDDKEIRNQIRRLTIDNPGGTSTFLLHCIPTHFNMDRRPNRKRRRRSNRDQPLSKQTSPIHFHKHILPCLAVFIYCSLSSCLVFPGSKRHMGVSALLLAPTTRTNRHNHYSAGRKARTFHVSSKATTATTKRSISKLLAAPDNGESSGDAWRSNLPRDAYASPLLWEDRTEWVAFLKQFGNGSIEGGGGGGGGGDPLWEQVKLEALTQLSTEPEAGPQLYQSILSQGSLVEAIVSIIANEVQSELVTATEIKQLFLDNLTREDEASIRCDVIAAATRSPSVELAVLAILFHTGLHALVCYRVGHRLWKADRRGLAKYLQSTVSGHYSADIHPACSMGQGIYLCTAAGVVIGETATVGNDVSILHGVTLGGTGKELGDRHPKVQHGVILKDCATVLGNIPVGTGAVVMAKAIVNKPVPPLAIMSGVPAKVVKSRTLSREAFKDDLEEHLAFKYLDEWKELEQVEQTDEAALKPSK